MSNSTFEKFLSSMTEDFKIDQKKLKKAFISIEEIGDSKADKLFDHTINPDEIIGSDFNNQATDFFFESFAKRENLTKEEFKQKCNSSKNTAYEYYKEAYYQKISVLSSIMLYKQVNDIIPCSLTSFSFAESFIMDSYLKFNSPHQNKNISLDKLMSEVNCALPSVSTLSWDEIFELRQDRRIKAFRNWINNNKESILDKGIESKLNEELWNAFKELKPNLLATFIKAVIGNVPIPMPINPIGIGTTIYDIGKDIKTQNKYALLSFINDIRERKNN
jgi:hypothetical protein